MIKRVHFKYCLAFVLVCLFSNCKTTKQMAYFQDLPQESASYISTAPYEPLKLQTNDEVQVNISSTSAEASQFFNLAAITPTAATGTPPIGAVAGYVNLYRVSSAGMITLPVLGDVPASGRTTEELRSDISARLKNYLKQSVVTVNLTNFKVTVIGEVNRPVVVPVNGQTINVLEAIGASGDLTAYGLRKNVKVIRKTPDGKTEVAVLNLNNSSIMKSPYFQLRQNDIVYVQPNKNKGLQGTKSGILIPIISSIAAITAIILTREL